MKLPPLNALRAFDTVARLGSVKSAASELFVTPAAVSQQVRHLETWLGAELVMRESRGVKLTDMGRQFHQATTRHLRAISQAAERIRPGRSTVYVTVIPSFAARWLVPRLNRFTDAYPQVEVRVDASPVLTDLGHGVFDLAIREGPGFFPDTQSHRLFTMDMVPVATPRYIASLSDKGSVDWPRARLLREVGDDWWSQWLEMAGIEGVDSSRGMSFSHTMLALSAAIEGQGIALTTHCLVRRELQEGELLEVDPRVLKTGYGYHVAWPRPEVRPLSEAAKRFCDWLIAAAEAETQALFI